MANTLSLLEAMLDHDVRRLVFSSTCAVYAETKTPRLVASSDKIRRELGGKPRYEELDQITATAWEWHRNHPEGYGG